MGKDIKKNICNKCKNNYEEHCEVCVHCNEENNHFEMIDVKNCQHIDNKMQKDFKNESEIEKMGLELCKTCRRDNATNIECICVDKPCSGAINIATNLYNAGYRKVKKISHIQAQKVYSESYLMAQNKKTLIEFIRCLEYNWNSTLQQLDQQEKNFNAILKEIRENKYVK